MNKILKYVIAGICLALVCAFAVYTYIQKAYPTVRCEAAVHLSAPAEIDCVTCHAKVSPKVVQDWKESKHGVMLVKCVVCHGEPDGKGSVPFSKRPDVNLICARCHDPAIKNMEAKFGSQDCYTCHPNHQNSQHSNTYKDSTTLGEIQP